jgi:hypothetical protein
VVIVSEAEWAKRKGAATLGDLLADFGERVGFDDDLFSEPIAKQDRPLGSDFLAEDD